MDFKEPFRQIEDFFNEKQEALQSMIDMITNLMIGGFILILLFLILLLYMNYKIYRNLSGKNIERLKLEVEKELLQKYDLSLKKEYKHQLEQKYDTNSYEIIYSNTDKKEKENELNQ